MITVKYPDEPTPITYLSEREREVIEAVKFLFGISVREVCAMAREIIRVGFDPIEATGPETKLGSSGAPDPYANVSLIDAWEVSQRDAKTCRLLLEDDDLPLQKLIWVYRNTMDWLRFWSVRFPSSDWRIEFARELERREEGLANLREKALSKGRLEVAQQLTTGD